MGSSADDLQIKITAAVSDAELSKVSRKIKDLTSDIKTMGETLAKVSGMLGGMGKVTTASHISGTPASSINNATSKGLGAAGGIAGGLTQAVTNSAALFRSAGEGSKSAFKMMNDALKDHTDRADREIKRLVNSLGTLEKEYDKVKSRQIAVGGNPGPAQGTILGQIHDEYISTTQQLAKARAHKKAVQGQLYSLNNPFGELTDPGPGGGSGGGGGFFSSLVSRFGPKGMLGAGLGAFGAVGAGVGALAGAAYMGAGFRNDHLIANLGLAQDLPLMNLNRASKFTGYFGGIGSSIMNRDITNPFAQQMVARSGIATKLFSNDYRAFVKEKILRENPTGIIQAAQQGGGIWDVGKGYAGKGIDDIVNAVTGDGSHQLMGVPNKTVQEINKKYREEFTSSLSVEKMQQAESAVKQLNPMFLQRLNESYAGAIGNLSAARTGGFGGGTIKLRNANGNLVDVDQMTHFNAMMTRAGYDPSEGLSMIQRMQSAAGRGNMHKSTIGMLSATYGGLMNAPELFGAGDQYGAGDLFIKGIQGLTGRGGLDPIAASQLFSAGTGLMTGGSYDAGPGIGLMQGLAQAAYIGEGAGAHLRGARQTAAGLGGLGDLLGGRVDPLQQALNASAAINAMPNGDYLAHKGLMSLDQGTMMEIMKTGTVPQRLRDRGIEYADVERYVKGQGSTMFSRFSPTMGGNTAIGQEIARYKKSGGLGYLKGLSREDQQLSLNRLAEGLMDTNGWDLEKSRGVLNLEAAAFGLLPDVAGKGAHQSASLKSVSGVAAGVQGDVLDTDAGAKGFEAKVYKDEIKKLPQVMAGNEWARINAGKMGGTGEAEAAIDAVSKALQNFVKAISGLSRPGEALRASPRTGK